MKSLVIFYSLHLVDLALNWFQKQQLWYLKSSYFRSISFPRASDKEHPVEGTVGIALKTDLSVLLEFFAVQFLRSKLV